MSTFHEDYMAFLAIDPEAAHPDTPAPRRPVKFDTVGKFRELQQDWDDAAALDQLQADQEVENES